MAIYKIFPEKSATLYSYYPTLNSGLDEILEIGAYLATDGTYQVARPLIQFPQDEIIDIIDNKVNGALYEAYLRLSLANASQIPLDYLVYCYPLVYSWNVGTGRYLNDPITTDGASWEYTDQLNGNVWVPNTYPAGATASYSSQTAGCLRGIAQMLVGAWRRPQAIW